MVKIHGSSKAKETKNAIFQCLSFKEENINEKIRQRFARPVKEADGTGKQEKSGDKPDRSIKAGERIQV